MSPPPSAGPPVEPGRAIDVDGAIDARTAPAWGEGLRAACASLAAQGEAPVLTVDLRPVRLLSAAAIGELTATRRHAATLGVDVVVLLEPGGWAHRMLHAAGLASSFTVLDEPAHR